MIRRDEIVARDVGHFPSLAIILSNAPDENNNNRPQSTLVERDPLSSDCCSIEWVCKVLMSLISMLIVTFSCLHYGLILILKVPEKFLAVSWFVIFKTTPTDREN